MLDTSDNTFDLLIIIIMGLTKVLNENFERSLEVMKIAIQVSPANC